jgi:hypothetical protein
MASFAFVYFHLFSKACENTMLPVCVCVCVCVSLLSSSEPLHQFPRNFVHPLCCWRPPERRTLRFPTVSNNMVEPRILFVLPLSPHVDRLVSNGG